MRQIADGIYVSGMTSVIEGRQSLALIDPGFEGALGPSRLETASGPVAEVLAFSHRLRKPIATIIATHSHPDHVACLPEYDRHLRADGRPADYRLVVHMQSPLWHARTLWVTRDACADLDGVAARFIPSPGHSQDGDEISVYLPAAGILFCGDVGQPQGESYDRCQAPSPVPLFADARAYVDTLDRLDALPFRQLQLGHGHTLDGAAGHEALRITVRVVRRIEVLAEKLVGENPGADPEEICEWIFDTVAYERGYGTSRAETRRRTVFHDGLTEFELFDRPGIADAVARALEHQRPDRAAAFRQGGRMADRVQEAYRSWQRVFWGRDR